MTTLIRRPEDCVWDDGAGQWIPLGTKHEIDFAHVVNQVLHWISKGALLSGKGKRAPQDHKIGGILF